MQESTTTTSEPTSQAEVIPTSEIDFEKVAEQLIQEEKFLNLIIVDLNKREINLKMVQYEMVLELREFLNEHVYTCFFTHYFFEHQGKQLNDYTELAELNLLEDPRIFMRPDKYDEKSTRQHIRRVQEILNSPPVLTSQVDSGNGVQEQNQEDEQKQEKEFNINTPDKENSEKEQEQQQENKDEEVALAQEAALKPLRKSSVGGSAKLQVDQEARLKKNYEDFMAIIEKESKKEIPMPPKNGHNLLRDLFTNQIEVEMNKVQHIKCIESIQFSSFNPIPPQRKMVGDLFYLTVKTLDAGEHGITCNINGFFKNANIEKVQFNPLPASQSSKGGSGNACFSYTLVGCLYQLSPLFGKNLELYINSILNTEPYFLTQPALPINFWVTQEDKNVNNKITQQGHRDQNAELNSTLVPLYGLDPKGIRDWNEEFQVVKDFPKEGFMQKIQRDRAISKVYNDFLDAATKGAIAIVNGNLMPLNPNESEKQQVFVYNYIFFSFAVDLVDSFKDLTSSENNPSFTQANHDIMGLRTLQILDIEGLHILATCLVQYKGHRVIAQSIIPGILNNNDLTSLAEYGSVDEQKTLYASENFHSLMKKVCEHLNIKVNKVIDGAEKEVEIAGSVEVKGIKGTDKRSYLVDLQGLTPRDANYKGDDFHTCLLRPELLMMYQRTKNIDYASTKMQELQKQIDLEESQAAAKEAAAAVEVKKNDQEESKEKTEADRDEQIKKRQEENLRKLREFDRYIKEAPKFVFNSNVFKNVKFALPQEEVAQDEALVEELAKFLKENAIDRLVKDLQNTDGAPTDSESLETAFHQHGINMRYLGAVNNVLKDTELTHFKVMLEKEVVFRSIKHIFNEQLRDSSNLYLSSVITHLFNLLLAPYPLIDLLNEGKIVYVDSTVQSYISKEGGNQQSQPDQFNTQAAAASNNSVSVEQVVEQQQQDSKTGGKKNKKKSKQQQDKAAPNGTTAENKVATGAATGPSDLSEMLFRPLGAEDSVPFSIGELFKDKTVASSLIKLEQPEVLSLKPTQLYEKIKVIAAKRYGYTLPENQTELKCLSSANNKLSLLRDICIKVGIQILAHSHKDYVLDNDPKVLQNKLAAAQKQQYSHQQDLNQSSQQSKAQNKKKNFQQQQQQYQQQLTEGGHLDISQITSYGALPFQIGDIVQLFPVLKHLDMQNNDVRSMLQSAKSAYKEGYYEKAFELYSQCINSLLQITGPMNKDVAACISKLASIQFKFGDFLQAIELQTKSIILQERLLGQDHPQTAYSYLNLALYHHTCGYFSKAFEYMYRSLNILKIVCGENHPDISSIYYKLGQMYQDIDNFQAAIDCFLESLYRNISLFGESHIQVANCYQTIAHAYFLLSDYRKALENQEKAHKILTAVLPAEDQHLKGSLSQIEQYMNLSVYMEKVKNAEKNQRTIGANKADKRSKGEEEAALRGDAQKISSLFQRLQDPKNRSMLDVLEYNHLKQQQSQAQKMIQDQLNEAIKRGELSGEAETTANVGASASTSTNTKKQNKGKNGKKQ